VTKPPCGDFSQPAPPAWWLNLVDQVHYLHFGLLLWFISGVVAVGISLATPPPPPSSLPRLTWWSRHSTTIRTTGDPELPPAPPKPKPVRSSLAGWRVTLNWVCGVEMVEEEGQQQQSAPPQKSPQQEAADAADSLYEPNWKKNLTDANAVLVMSVAMFFWGFYA